MLLLSQGHGIIGCFHFTDSYYLLVVARREYVGHICGEQQGPFSYSQLAGQQVQLRLRLSATYRHISTAINHLCCAGRLVCKAGCNAVRGDAVSTRHTAS
jgi:hypothetical protein